MNLTAANKLLKSFEEPPEKTFFIMVAEHYDLILPTIRSRTQMIKIPLLTVKSIQNALIHKFSELLSDNEAMKIAQMAHGSWNEALSLVEKEDESAYNFTKFREWMRLCYIRNDYYSLNNLIQEISRLGKEKQKQFLIYGLKVVQNGLMANQNMNEHIFADTDEKEYFIKFAPFINEANQKEMYKLMNDAVYHLERNAHSPTLFTHLTFQLIDLLIKGREYIKIKN